ncbi:MAG TPA: sugar phosphate nucleotidyltransferase [Thermoanaerobaculaceae bacterium]|nr:sugar phosphate nucleotidyltransferase [Thermoanaerobaculaceae bacterium]
MTSSADGAPLFAVVMAGGAGTRFWPLSRRSRPKQLLPFAQGRSLLAATVERLAPLVAPERTLVVTSLDVADAVRAEVGGIPPANVLAEPEGRDTAACVGWAAWRLARTSPGAVMVVVPADHLIPDGAALRSALAAAAATAFARGGLVTLGVRPTRPETGFGYLEVGEAVGTAGAHRVREVRRFVEKPDRATAEAFLEAGGFYWNSGMFAWRVQTIVEAFRAHLPRLANGLDELASASESLGETEALRRHYPSLEKVSVDFGVMEKAAPVWAIEVDFAWSDVGSWAGLAEAMPRSECGVSLGDVLALDSGGSVLVSDGPLVATVGVRDLVVVATRDAVLVVPRDQVQRVKELVETLRAKGRGELL